MIYIQEMVYMREAITMDYPHYPRKGTVGADDVQQVGLNINPLCRMTNDCIFRAVAGATDQKWRDVFAVMSQMGLEMHMMPDYPAVLRAYMDKIGAEYVYKSTLAAKGKPTIREFIQSHRQGNYVIRVLWHVTRARDGILYDWVDCLNEPVLEAWLVPRHKSLVEGKVEDMVPWLYEKRC